MLFYRFYTFPAKLCRLLEMWVDELHRKCQWFLSITSHSSSTDLCLKTTRLHILHHAHLPMESNGFVKDWLWLGKCDAVHAWHLPLSGHKFISVQPSGYVLQEISLGGQISCSSSHRVSMTSGPIRNNEHHLPHFTP